MRAQWSFIRFVSLRVLKQREKTVVPFFYRFNYEAFMNSFVCAQLSIDLDGEGSAYNGVPFHLFETVLYV